MRRIAALALLTFVAVLCYAGNAFATDTYYALGDSYSSGVGTRAYYDSNCKRSYWAYPQLIADHWPHKPNPPVPKSTGVNLHNYTCAGATVSTVLSTQVPHIPNYTTYVTISVGAGGQHPSLSEHSIRYIALYKDTVEIDRVYLHPVYSAPTVTFTIALDEGGSLRAIAEPNHSAAWETSKKIEVLP
jgi:desulfoferrodoxin (superoxide reductase-like protein)